MPPARLLLYAEHFNCTNPTFTRILSTMTTTDGSKGDPIIDDFVRSWEHARAMTYDFIDAVPASQWHFSPHPTCAPLAKQFRHMIWVSGCYNDGLENGVLDLSKKKTFYAGGLDRDEIVAGLRATDAELTRILRDVEATGVKDRRVELPFLGRAMRFGEFAAVVIRHESLHQGLWSLYARIGGFATPNSWQFNWDL